MELRVMRRKRGDDPFEGEIVWVGCGQCIERGRLRQQVQRLWRDRIHRKLLVKLLRRRRLLLMIARRLRREHRRSALRGGKRWYWESGI